MKISWKIFFWEFPVADMMTGFQFVNQKMDKQLFSVKPLGRWTQPSYHIYVGGCGGVVSEGEVKKGLMGGSARKLTWGHTHTQ